MIVLYTGAPGNGKSYHMAKQVYRYLRNGNNVITNLPIDISRIKPKRKKQLGHFIFISDERMGAYDAKNCTSDFISGLYGFALNFHVRDAKGKYEEGQTVLIIDECQQDDILNCRTYNRPNRREFNKFFQMHRHYGFDVILGTQDAANVDKQTRKIVQTEAEHRKLSTYKLFGKVLTFLIGHETFIVIERNMSLKRSPTIARMGSYYIVSNRKVFDLYNSYNVVDCRR